MLESGEIAQYPVAERWVYLISFEPPPPPGCYDCISTPFKIVVLMDGVAVRGNQIALESPLHLGENLPSLRSHLSKFSLLLTA